MFELGRSFGVTVAQENVNMFWSNSPLFIKHMKMFCKEKCAFVFDIKQAVRGGKDPFEICGAMGESIVHIHLNDNNANSDCLLPGEGDMDYGRLMGMLRDLGYGGDLIIEVYRNSFGSLNELYTAKNNVKKIAGML
jgi:sugar phosphate isomerase/epimerase